MLQNNDGESPLPLASLLGQVDAARMLIEHGADLTAQNNDGVTSDVNSINFGLGVTTRLCRIACIMLEHGANVNGGHDNHRSWSKSCEFVFALDILVV